MNAIAHAFLYENGQMRDLGTFPGGTSSAALGINISGQIVGYGTYGSSSFNHAFLYRGEGPMQDLGDLSSVQNHSSWAKDINDRDQVVGYSDNDYSSTHYNRAFLYENEEMIDLGTRLHPDNNGNIWNLDAANGINNEGQIVTEGWRKESDGITYTYSGLLLTPTSNIPPPPDSEAPSAPTVTSPQNNSYDKDGSFSVSGSAEAASTVELFEGTTSRGTTKADSSSGAWSIDLSGLSDGTHTYTAKAKDAAGNTSSASNSVSVKVDSAPPETKIDSGPSGPTNDNTPTFSFGGLDNLSQAANLRYSYKVDGSAWSSYSSETSVTLGSASGLSEGSHTFYVKAKDEADNEDQSPAQSSFTVDTTQPMVKTTTPSGATPVARGTDLTASFSEKMGPRPSIRPPSSSSRSTQMAPRRRSLTWWSASAPRG